MLRAALFAGVIIATARQNIWVPLEPWRSWDGGSLRNQAVNSLHEIDTLPSWQGEVAGIQLITFLSEGRDHERSYRRLDRRHRDSQLRSLPATFRDLA